MASSFLHVPTAVQPRHEARGSLGRDNFSPRIPNGNHMLSAGSRLRPQPLRTKLRLSPPHHFASTVSPRSSATSITLRAHALRSDAVPCSPVRPSRLLRQQHQATLDAAARCSSRALRQQHQPAPLRKRSLCDHRHCPSPVSTRQPGTSWTQDRAGQGIQASADAFVVPPATDVPQDPDTWQLPDRKWAPVSGIPQDNPLGHRELAEQDSLFLRFRGVDIHYKKTEPLKENLLSESTGAVQAEYLHGTDAGHAEYRRSTGAVLLHGFGASSFSWAKLMAPLATVLQGPVLAFDRPGFGISERVEPPPLGTCLADPAANPYSLAFSAAVASAFGRQLAEETGSKPILVGHSAGCLVAVQAALHSPGLASALVLIAPAIMAPVFNGSPNPAGAGAAAAAAAAAEAQGPPAEAAGAAAVAAAASAGASAESKEPPAEANKPSAELKEPPAEASKPPGAANSRGRALNLWRSIAAFFRPLTLQLTLRVLQLALLLLNAASTVASSLSKTLTHFESKYSTVWEESRAQARAGGAAGTPLAALRQAPSLLVSLLLSLVCFLLAQGILAVLRLAEGVSAVGGALGFGWTGLSALLSASLLRNVVARAILRRTFNAVGVPGVRSAWADPSACTSADLAGYTKPLLSRNWDRALLEFVVAAGLNPRSKMNLRHISCPVLIITGDKDTIVPPWNALRLAKAIPGSTFRVIKDCGHLPQEEKPREVLRLLEEFLQKKKDGLASVQ